jgi:hypothetical protein
MKSRSCSIRTVLPIVGAAAMLMVTANASAQACGDLSLIASAQTTVSGTGASLFASRAHLARDLQFRSAHLYSTNYAPPPPGLYGYSHYGPIAGAYTNHYGYYVRPYVRWTPRFGWVRHRFHRRH